MRLPLTALAVICAWPLQARATEITIFAAASLKTALDAIAADWQAETGTRVVIAYAGTSALARQIEQGAPADLFLASATNWMDHLQEEALIKPETRRDLLCNTLVLVGFGADLPQIALGPGLDLTGLLAGGKLAMAMVDSVPAGQYGKAALESLGLWTAVEGSVAQSDNVRSALVLVATGEAPYGIVYASDAVAQAASGDRITVVARFPAGSHPPIIYPGAVLARSDAPEAEAFLDHLSGPVATGIFSAQGFVPLTQGAPCSMP